MGVPPEDAAARIAELEARLARVAVLEEENRSLRAALAANVARTRDLEAQNRGLAAQNRDLAAQNRDLAAQNRDLATKLEALLEQLGQDSSNSHKPPSSDGPGAAGRKGRLGKARSKRKRGGQKGHRGAKRRMFEPGEVDNVVDLFPAKCSGCGDDLPKTPDDDPRRHQRVDIDRQGRVVTEWRRHQVRCPRCGARTRADYDPNVIPACPFGPGLCARVVMMTGKYRLSRRDAAQVFWDLFGIRISVGSVSNIEARATSALQPAAQEAARQVDDAPVKHTDGTTWLKAGRLLSLWTVASTAATVFRIFENGRTKTIKRLFRKRTGILVSDRASVFGFWPMEKRQVCWAHMLRKFVAFSQRAGPAGAIGRELVDCTALLFEYWQGFKSGKLTRAEFQEWMTPVRQCLEETLERAVRADLPRLSGSCKDILDHREALWTFVTEEGVEPTNNHAEQQLRRFVLWRKCCYGSQSERGLRFAERMMTVAQTCRKQGLNVLEFLTRTFLAHTQGTPPPSLFAAAT